MSLYFISILLVIASNLFYHVFQKTIPSGVNPMISLIATYGTALLASIIVLFFYPAESGVIASFKELNWASFALGVAIVGLEVGFLLAYRAGWNISLAALFSNVAVSILLIPIGLLFFKEYLTVKNVVGITLSMIGIFLIAHK